jgi:hypothetical protein
VSASRRIVFSPRKVARAPIAFSNATFENFESLCFVRHNQYNSRPLTWNSSIALAKPFTFVIARLSSGPARNPTLNEPADATRAGSNARYAAIAVTSASVRRNVYTS